MTSSLERTKLAWTGFRGKTLWDWLRFLTRLIGTIAIPLVIFYATSVFTTHQQSVADAQHRNELNAAKEQQRETVLKAYLDDMSTLLLDYNLHNAASAREVRDVARVRTLTTLLQLDGTRKGILLQCLYEAGLIGSPNAVIPLVSLVGADLRGADLHKAVLAGADLQRAILIGADLRDANLAGANLHSAYLFRANLDNAVLHDARLDNATLINANLHSTDLHSTDLHSAGLIGANLRGADLRGVSLTGANLHNAIMPNGSIHP